MASRLMPKLQVYLNDTLRNDLRPLVVQRSINGQGADYAILEYDRSVSAKRIRNIRLAANTNQFVEITGTIDGAEKVYFWGQVSQSRVTLNSRVEREEAIARIEKWHFGAPVWGQVVWSWQSERHEHIDAEIVFNPVFDDKFRPNMEARDPLFGPGLTKYFIDPASLQSEKARLYQDSTTQLWTLGNVVQYLCWQANPRETYIANPTELFVTFDDSRDHIRDLRLRPGLYLPDLLDAVCEPFGYGWYVELVARGQRKIRFFKRGKGARITDVVLQPPGATVKAGPKTAGASNVAASAIEYNLSDLYNQIRGLGDWLQIESTWELVKSWPTTKDSLRNTPDVLSMDHADFEANHDVWRKWTLNEASDYTGIRVANAEPFDFRQVIADVLGINKDAASPFCVPRRRRFLPTLTVDGDNIPIGEVEGCTVECFNPTSGISTWVKVPFACSVLNEECGVYFRGEKIQPILVQDGTRIRVTATIRFDLRVQGFAARQNTSAQGQIAELLLDLRDRFHHRVVHKGSIYYDAVKKGDKKPLDATLAADEKRSLSEDDRAALQTYCEQIREAWDLAMIQGPLEIEGVDWDYELGDSITRVAGREISLNARTSGQHYPQVIGITTDFLEQRTMLQLAQFKNRVRFAKDKQGIDL